MTEGLKLKVGLLVVSAVVMLLLTVTWLGTGELWEEKISCTTYFSESVIGLEEGSIVRYRGIPFGRISRISIAPDGEHIALHFEVHIKNLDLETVATLKNLQRVDWSKNGLRMRISSQGFTGIKFLEGDIVDPREYPKEKLSFPVPSNYIPSAPSAFTNIERSAVRIIAQIEESDIKGIAANLKAVLASLDGMINEARGKMDAVANLLEASRASIQSIEREVAPLAAAAKETMADSRQTLKSFEKLAGTAEETLRQMQLPETMKNVNALLARVGEATDRMASAADAMSGTMQDLRGDLRSPLVEMERTLQSLRVFINYMERNPAALIHGRTDK